MMRPVNQSARGATTSAKLTSWACAMLIVSACSSDGDATEPRTTPGTEKPDAASGNEAPGASSRKDAGGAAGPSSRSDAGGPAASRRDGGTGTQDAGEDVDNAVEQPDTGDAGSATAEDAGRSPAAARPLSSTLKLPTMMETPGVAPYFHVWRPTDLSAVEGKLPVVVWNNGACSRNDQVFKPLFEKWASGGYVVLSLTSGGGSSSTTIADQKGLLEWVVTQAGKAGGPYNEKLDLDRIAAGGNSCGGITSLGLASMDERVAAVFVLSGSTAMGSPNKTVINGIKIPVAYVVGGTEDIARANAEADYQAFAAGLPAMMVKRSSGDHLTISNNAMVMADAADISINWLDLTLFGLQGALDALKAPTVCAGCQSGLWTLTAKNLETLVK